MMFRTLIVPYDRPAFRGGIILLIPRQHKPVVPPRLFAYHFISAGVPTEQRIDSLASGLQILCNPLVGPVDNILVAPDGLAHIAHVGQGYTYRSMAGPGLQFLCPV